MAANPHPDAPAPNADADSDAAADEAIAAKERAEDHDQRLKELIQVCFIELMDWVRPGWSENFRFDRAEWLKQEIFVDMPVFSQALLLRLGLTGVGRGAYATEYFDDQTRVSGWRYVGLPALDGLAYIEGDNILATALSPLMQVPEADRMRACAQALEKIHDHPGSRHKRFLLGECVQAYGRLSRSRWKWFMASLTTPQLYSGADRMVSLIFREGEQKGRCLMFLNILKSTFSNVDAETERRVRTLSEAQMNELVPVVLNAKSLSEVPFPEPKSKLPRRHGNQNGDSNGK